MKGRRGSREERRWLRRRAEKQLEEKGAGGSGKTEARDAPEGLSAQEARLLLHDLQVHQVELETQNEELRRIQQELVAARDRYAELYDFAPVGYVTVSQTGLILEANLTLARMLGVERGRLLKRRLSAFMLQPNGDDYYLHRQRVLQTGQVQACDVRMVRKDGRRFWARLEAMAASAGQGGGTIYRAAVSDVTGAKQTEEALRQSERDLARHREELRALSGNLLKTHEGQRRDLSRELHDDFNQRLAMLVVDVETLEQRTPLPAKVLRKELGTLKARLAELCEDVRRLAYQLHPSVLEHLGLEAALRSYCAEFTRREKIQSVFVCRGKRLAAPQDVALCLYRVAQEALHNVARHSGAARVTLTLAGTRREVRLEVADRGRGFDPGRVGELGGLGLISMGERVRLVGGRLEVKSRLGGGTEVCVKVPLSKEPEGETGAAGSQRGFLGQHGAMLGGRHPGA